MSRSSTRLKDRRESLCLHEHVFDKPDKKCFLLFNFLRALIFLAGVLGSTWANGSISTRFHVRVVNIPVEIDRLKYIEA